MPRMTIFLHFLPLRFLLPSPLPPSIPSISLFLFFLESALKEDNNQPVFIYYLVTHLSLSTYLFILRGIWG